MLCSTNGSKGSKSKSVWFHHISTGKEMDYVLCKVSESRVENKIKTQIFIFYPEAHPIFTERSDVKLAQAEYIKNAILFLHC